jgi:hypothetical protein
MASDAQAKITNELESRLRQRKGDVLDVIVELVPDSAAPSSPPEMRAAFERELAPVSDEISRCGGSVVGSAWLNRTLHAKVPAAKVAKLRDLREVAVLDVPHALEPE